MWPENKVVRGAIIGGVLALVVHAILRFCISNWRLVLTLFVVAKIMSACSG